MFVKLQRKVCAYNEGSRLVDVEAAGNGYAEVAGWWQRYEEALKSMQVGWGWNTGGSGGNEDEVVRGQEAAYTRVVCTHARTDARGLFFIFWKNKARFLFSCQNVLFRMLAYSPKKKSQWVNCCCLWTHHECTRLLSCFESTSSATAKSFPIFFPILAPKDEREKKSKIRRTLRRLRLAHR